MTSSFRGLALPHCGHDAHARALCELRSMRELPLHNAKRKGSPWMFFRAPQAAMPPPL
jgi:hypothetical protein